MQFPPIRRRIVRQERAYGPTVMWAENLTLRFLPHKAHHVDECDWQHSGEEPGFPVKTAPFGESPSPCTAEVGLNNGRIGPRHISGRPPTGSPRAGRS